MHYVPPPFDGWLLLDYDGVKRVLADHDVFSSRVPGPQSWFIFSDPPAHAKMRAIVSRAFTPRIVANLEPQVRELSRGLLDHALSRGVIDIALDFSVPLAINVIATIMGIPTEDWPLYRRWSDTILALSNVRAGGPQAQQAIRDFSSVTAEMSDYLAALIERRLATPQDDLVTRLVQAEVDGERLFHEEILGFFQLMIVAGQETTSDLINNSVLCLMENPEQLAVLRAQPELLPSAIEEVLRFRSPTQWVTRIVRRDIELHGALIKTGAFVMPVIGSANRDPRQFPNPDRFDISRDSNSNIAFGHGIHFCLGSALSRMEARVAVSEILAKFKNFEPDSSQPWEPRNPIQVHGPSSLPIRFEYC